MSNILKPAHYVPAEQSKAFQVPVKPLSFPSAHFEDEASGFTPEEEAVISEAEALKRQIISDAESFAQTQIQEAFQETSELRSQAEAEIEAWWNQRREEDEQQFEASRETGYDTGYKDGLMKAQEDIHEQHAEMLQEAQNVLQQAYQVKQQIIQESEPFLIELSCSIAEKIISKQLTLTPDWVLDTIRSVLSRRKETGVITLCVAPKQFSYIQDAREELLSSIDSQAELQIIPDASVQDQGCVVRSTFGSIDARIDTQLHEIKIALQRIALHGEGDET
ncbi:FliH/SctL family protein [Paenibacillus lutrae]|uniref:Flagellar assembly protein FliH n=1 Tax=Paenibacillus lutrae TaxID=2078573 RepID=A0A7X3FG55_9BACL|nr:FliH/SctL family protein [Paenibacillus lutrae]MVO99160.1 flagellar assembly protein FliH [Paenibacillus lutrae]